jgi:ribosomal protein S18 acetylase RimI-like enzyme
LPNGAAAEGEPFKLRDPLRKLTHSRLKLRQALRLVVAEVWSAALHSPVKMLLVLCRQRQGCPHFAMTAGSQLHKISIEQAASRSHISAARELFLEYGHSLGFSLCFQSFDDELASLPGKYAPPKGRLLLAYVGDQLAGCGALRPLRESGICEMKRLYVRSQFRGLGLGRRLARKLIDEARQIGYRKMRLDTVADVMREAVAMYRSLGFYEIAPYTSNPQPSTLYMEIELSSVLL